MKFDGIVFNDMRKEPTEEEIRENLDLGAGLHLFPPRTGRSRRRQIAHYVSEPCRKFDKCPVSEQCELPIGEYSRVQDVLNIQPVVPFHVSED